MSGISMNSPFEHLQNDEILVEVHAAGLNLLHPEIRDGKFNLVLPYRSPRKAPPPIGGPSPPV